MKPHKRSGRAAKQRRQESAVARQVKTPEERLLVKVFGKKKEK